jgi:hypothetical protein
MKAEQQRLPRFAVLIDADNTSPQIAGGLFEEVAKFGEASVRRIYGDFSGGQLKSWADILQEHAIDPSAILPGSPPGCANRARTSTDLEPRRRRRVFARRATALS